MWTACLTAGCDAETENVLNGNRVSFCACLVVLRLWCMLAYRVSYSRPQTAPSMQGESLVHKVQILGPNRGCICTLKVMNIIIWYAVLVPINVFH